MLEGEVRAGTIAAVEAIKTELSKLGKAMTAIEIDWHLWERGE